MQHGLSEPQARRLAHAWVITGDYLLDTADLINQADFVVGNPPYIRLEDLERGGEAYRAAYPTMVGRADIYVAFFEAALRHLRPEGVCGFICADRWMFNQYGAELRAFITSRFGVDAIIQMHHANAFEAEVSAYPAITIIRNGPQQSVVVANLEAGDEQMGTTALRNEIRMAALGQGRTNAARIEQWFHGTAPWPLMQPDRLALLRRLESDFPALEETGAIVGIGVATGADRIFITKNPHLVESERLLPLAMAFDAKGDALSWTGHYLVNPWNENGLVNFDDYPMLAGYLSGHREKLESRHVGKKSPGGWYRTIDRVNHALTGRKKLYFPDFKGRIAPVLDPGETYPHHNLYFVASDEWDLEVLGGILLSDIAQFFIEAYGVRMRGGYLRFQAQYLRRLCVPRQSELSQPEVDRLRTAFVTRDIPMANEATSIIYRLTAQERSLLGHSE